MSNNTLIVDANSVGRAAHAGTKLHVNLGGARLQTQAAFSFIRGLAEDRRRWPDYTPLVLWDGKTDWRFKLLPTYKGNRDDDAAKIADREAYNAIRPFIHQLLQHLGVRQLTASTHEADDMAGYFVARMTQDPKAKIKLKTGDKDWIQLVRPGVEWYDHRNDLFVNHENFYDKTGCKSPFAFLETKILAGDSSDCIPGVGGIGDKGAPEFIATYGSVRNFWKLVDCGALVPKTKAHRLLAGNCEFSADDWECQYQGHLDDTKALKKHMDTWPGQGRQAYKRNFQLMQLLRVTPPTKSALNVNVGRFDPDAFAAVCKQLGFVSILRKLDEFVAPFQQ